MSIDSSFSIYLNASNTSSGQLIIGGIDSSLGSDFEYYDVISESEWMIEMKSFILDGVELIPAGTA